VMGGDWGAQFDCGLGGGHGKLMTTAVLVASVRLAMVLLVKPSNGQVESN
jgi:hypothetical protein